MKADGLGVEDTWKGYSSFKTKLFFPCGLHLPVPPATSVKATGSLLLPLWAASTLESYYFYLSLLTVSSVPTTVSCYSPHCDLFSNHELTTESYWCSTKHSLRAVAALLLLLLTTETTLHHDCCMP